MQASQYRHINLVNTDVLKLCAAKLDFASFSPQKKSLTAALFIKESVFKNSGKNHGNMVCLQLFCYLF